MKRKWLGRILATALLFSIATACAPVDNDNNDNAPLNDNNIERNNDDRNNNDMNDNNNDNNMNDDNNNNNNNR